jgi:hypothetical protein
VSKDDRNKAPPQVISEPTPEQAEKVCAALRKRAKATGINMMTFYMCVSPADASPKPPELPKR